jgi:adenosylcobinamide-phosphate synthase
MPGAVCYRAINTLDSMIGYHGKYEYLGKASARFDDLLNLIPARVTALLILIGGALSNCDVVRGLRTLWRDGAVTESPNAGRPMAAMAGLLRVELEKVGHYKLGEPIEALTVEKIDRAWRVVTLAAMTGVLLFAVAQGVWHAYAR